MKHNIKNYFTNYETQLARMQKAQALIERLGGDLQSASVFDIITMSGNGMFSPQKRTGFIEEKMKSEFGWKTVRTSEERGDYIDHEGKYFELKCSSSNDNGTINLLQIRPWQNVDYYLVIYFDLDTPNQSKVYRLTKNDMLKQVEERGYPCHGTRTANESNGKIEYSIHLPIENEWDEQFLVEGFLTNI